MAKNEHTSKPIAKIAAKALHDPKSVTPKQVQKLAGSALTQRPDHKKK